MYNQTLIAERLGIIRSSVKRLKLLGLMPLDQFCKDEDAIDIAENRLRRLVLVGSMLPDIIDNPLGGIILRDNIKLEKSS